MMLTEKMGEWISHRKKRFQILLDLRDGKIDCIEAEKRLRAIDGETHSIRDFS